MMPGLSLFATIRKRFHADRIQMFALSVRHFAYRGDVLNFDSMMPD
jgi:hypothetical protein